MKLPAFRALESWLHCHKLLNHWLMLKETYTDVLSGFEHVLPPVHGILLSYIFPLSWTENLLSRQFFSRQNNIRKQPIIASVISEYHIQR